MRKFLALVLALVMTMSLVTVSAGAATDFADDADITNAEAVEVLNAMGVLTGNNGKFNPNGKLTRGAGAKIIAYLMLGQSAADKLTATYTVFEDVTDSVGLAAYIEWAEANDIVGGYGNGKFGPYDTLTEYAFGKMLLAALGYDVEAEGYTGAGWQKNVYRDALNAGIYDGTETYGACTRDTAARMALGALQADVVLYGSNDVAGGLYWNGILLGTGNTVSGRIETNRAMWEFYPGLELIEAGVDTFGRPGHKWVYSTKTTDFEKFYMDAPIAEHTTAVTECNLLVDCGLAKTSKKDVEIFSFVNGELKENGADHNHTTTCGDATKPVFGGQGVLTQVFEIQYFDLAAQDVVTAYVVTEIDTYLAQVDDVTATTHLTAGETKLDVYDGTAPSTAAAQTVYAAGNLGFAEGEYVLVHISGIVETDALTPKFLQRIELNGGGTAFVDAGSDDSDLLALDSYDYFAKSTVAGHTTDTIDTNATVAYVGVEGAPSVISGGKFTGIYNDTVARVTINGVREYMAAHYEKSVDGLADWTIGSKLDFLVDQYNNIIGDVVFDQAFTYGVIDRMLWIEANSVRDDGYAETLVYSFENATEGDVVNMIKYNGKYIAGTEAAGVASLTDPTVSDVMVDNAAYMVDGAYYGVVINFGDGNLVPVKADTGTANEKYVAAKANTVNITKGNPDMPGALFDVNNNTKFLVKTLNADYTNKYTAYAGIDNVPTIIGAKNVVTVKAVDTDAYASFVYIDATNSVFAGSSAIVYADTQALSKTYSATGETYEYKLWLNGVETTLYATAGATNIAAETNSGADLFDLVGVTGVDASGDGDYDDAGDGDIAPAAATGAAGFYKLSFNEAGMIIKAEAALTAGGAALFTLGTVSADVEAGETVIKIGGTPKNLAGATIYQVASSSNNWNDVDAVTVITADQIDAGTNNVYVKYNAVNAYMIDEIYVLVQAV